MIIYKIVTKKRYQSGFNGHYNQKADFGGYYLFGFIPLYLKQVTKWE